MGNRTLWSGRAWGSAGALMAAVLLSGACNNGATTAAPGAGASGGSPTGGPSSSNQPAPSAQTTPAVLQTFPADRATGVRPGDPVTVVATTGELQSVAVRDAAGRAVPGAMSKKSSAWSSSGLLRPDTAYTVTVKSTGPDGTATTTTTRFRTLKPAVTATYTVIPNGGTVGVGMPVVVQFDSPVATKAMRAEVEKRVKVTTSPQQAGAWGWLDNRQLMWRPAAFWKPGT
ncbi:MAG: Ig-like domain-containing protein, partial [Catenulispora sp.]